MNIDDLAYLRTWFSDYVADYYRADPVHNKTIRLKEEHTARVCKEMLLAETMALFHDLGRFQQYVTYGTFEDARSENHAALGLRELAKHRVFSVCTGAEQSLVKKAIGYHNVRKLPTDETEQVLFVSRLLRDADKLDIWRVFIDYYDGPPEHRDSTIVWGLPNDPTCSPKIVSALSRQEMADTRDMATLNDYKLLQISWVFDVNFSPTFNAVYERQYVQKIAATFTPGIQVAPIVETVLAYLLNRKSKPIPCPAAAGAEGVTTQSEMGRVPYSRSD
jgi:hypothetical protein